jgi:predicted ATPase
MLETIHQYAIEKLREAEELEQFHQRHFFYFLQAALRNEQELHSSLQLKAFLWLAIEQANLKAALDWANAGSPPNDAGGAQRLSMVMHLDFHQHGTHRLRKIPPAF